jgi:hypothetical protein
MRPAKKRPFRLRAGPSRTDSIQGAAQAKVDEELVLASTELSEEQVKNV